MEKQMMDCVVVLKRLWLFRKKLPKTPVWRPAVTLRIFWWIFCSATTSSRFPWELFSKSTLTLFNANVNQTHFNFLFVLCQYIDFEIDRICRFGTRSRFRRRDVTLVLFGPAPTAGFVVVLGLVSLFPRLWPGDEQVSARVPPTSYNRLGKVRGVVTLIESTIFYRRLVCR